MEWLKLIVDAASRLLANYLEFSSDLLALRNLGPYVLSDEISPTLLSYFLVGISLAYLLTMGSAVPGIAGHVADPDKRKAEDRLAFGSAMVRVVLAAVGCHAILYGISELGDFAIGSIRVTVNAWLATAALTLPFYVVARRLGNSASGFFRALRGEDAQNPAPGRRLRRMGSISPEISNLILCIVLVGAATLLDVVIFIYYGLVLAHLHRLHPFLGLLPSLLYTAALFVIIAGIRGRSSGGQEPEDLANPSQAEL